MRHINKKHVNKLFWPCFHTTKIGMLKNMYQRSSEAIIQEFDKFWPCCTSVNLIHNGFCQHPPHLLMFSHIYPYDPLPHFFKASDYICDMIKGNESDVGNIDFELQAKIDNEFLCFTLFLNFTELFISLQPDVRLRWPLDQNVAF